MVMEVMVVGPRCLWVLVPIFLSYKNAMQNYFCETMKYEKMNDGIFLFLRFHSKCFLRGFYAPQKLFTWGLNF